MLARPQTGGLDLTVESNVSVQVERTTTTSLAIFRAMLFRNAEVPRMSGLSTASTLCALNTVASPAVVSGATFVAAGSSVNVIVFEARNPTACGESSPTEIDDGLVRTLRFVDWDPGHTCQTLQGVGR